MDDLKEKFSQFLKNEKKVKQSTLVCYMHDIDRLEEIMLSFGYDGIGEISSENFALILGSLERSGRSAASIARFSSSVRTFCRFLTFEGLIDRGVEINCAQSQKAERNDPDTLTELEVSMLLSAPNRNTFKGMRDRSMIELCYASSLRIAELLSLDVADVNVFTCTICCKNPKGARYAQIYPSAAAALGDYITYYTRMYSLTPGKSPLFVNQNNQRLTRQGLWKIIKEYAEQAGIGKEVTPLVLRRSYAAHLASKGAGPEEIKKSMDYRSLASAKVYLK